VIIDLTAESEDEASADVEQTTLNALASMHGSARAFSSKLQRSEASGGFGCNERGGPSATARHTGARLATQEFLCDLLKQPAYKQALDAEEGKLQLRSGTTLEELPALVQEDRERFNELTARVQTQAEVTTGSSVQRPTATSMQVLNPSSISLPSIFHPEVSGKVFQEGGHIYKCIGYIEGLYDAQPDDAGTDLFQYNLLALKLGSVSQVKSVMHSSRAQTTAATLHGAPVTGCVSWKRKPQVKASPSSLSRLQNFPNFHICGREGDFELEKRYFESGEHEHPEVPDIWSPAEFSALEYVDWAV